MMKCQDNSTAVPRRRGLWAVRRLEAAFTLLEVMIAASIFFGCIIAILGLMTRSLAAARGLQSLPPDPSTVAAQLAITNVLQEGAESGDFGELHPNATWTRNVYEVGSNGLFQVDIYIYTEVRGKQTENITSLLMYRPGSSPSGAGGGLGGGTRFR